MFADLTIAFRMWDTPTTAVSVSPLSTFYAGWCRTLSFTVFYKVFTVSDKFFLPQLWRMNSLSRASALSYNLTRCFWTWLRKSAIAPFQKHHPFSYKTNTSRNAQEKDSGHTDKRKVRNKKTTKSSILKSYRLQEKWRILYTKIRTQNTIKDLCPSPKKYVFVNNEEH